MPSNWVWDSYGASARGLGHSRRGEPNQDAWLRRRYMGGEMIVVCDGLGSRRSSDIGARQACMAAADAFRLWSAVEGAPLDYLLALVWDLWRVRVHDGPPVECATTCLLAFGMPNGRAGVAQLGDGLAMLTRPGEAPVVLSAIGDRDFANETTALSPRYRESWWSWYDEPNAPPGTRIVLATDGVSEDLDTEMLESLAEHLGAEYAGLEAVTRWRRLSAELRNWPVRHGDDKTVAVLWRNPT